MGISVLPCHRPPHHELLGLRWRQARVMLERVDQPKHFGILVHCCNYDLIVSIQATFVGQFEDGSDSGVV